MSNSDTPDRRMPPRFVPTLTEVVGQPAAPAVSTPVSSAAQPAVDAARAPTSAAAPGSAAAPKRPPEVAVPSAAPATAPSMAAATPAAALGSFSEADLASLVTRLVLRSDFQDKLAQAVATVVAQ